jgi:hypothetical protein
LPVSVAKSSVHTNSPVPANSANGFSSTTYTCTHVMSAHLAAHACKQERKGVP